MTAGSAQQALEALARRYNSEVQEPPGEADEPQLWRGTALGIAGVPLLVAVSELEEIIETPAVTPIPGTKAWVLGVAAHMGGVLPILSGDALFRRRPHTGRVREFCMVIKRPGMHFGMTLSDVERDMKFPVAERDREHPVDEDFAPFTDGGFHRGERFLAVLDIDRLVADSDLGNAAATRAPANEEYCDE